MEIKLYWAGKLSPDMPESLQLAIFLAFRKAFNLKGNLNQLKFGDFSLIQGGNGQDYIEMRKSTQDEKQDYPGQERKVLEKHGFVMDPVKLFKKFCSIRPHNLSFPESPLFLVPDAKFSVTLRPSFKVWYHPLPIEKNYFENLLINLKNSIKTVSPSSNKGSLAQNQRTPIITQSKGEPILTKVQVSLHDPKEDTKGGSAVAQNQMTSVMAQGKGSFVLNETEVQESCHTPNEATQVGQDIEEISPDIEMEFYWPDIEYPSPDIEMKLHCAGLLSSDTPKSLQFAIFFAFKKAFNLTENLNQLKFGNFSFIKGDDGEEYIEMLKSTQDQKQNYPDQGKRLLGRNEFVEIDPIQLFKKFCSVRPHSECFPESPLFLSPNANFYEDGDPGFRNWYLPQPIENNYFKKCLKKLRRSRRRRNERALDCSAQKDGSHVGSIKGSIAKNQSISVITQGKGEPILTKNQGSIFDPRERTQGVSVEGSSVAQNQKIPVITQVKEVFVLNETEAQDSLHTPKESTKICSTEDSVVAEHQISPTIKEGEESPAFAVFQGRQFDPKKGTPGSSAEEPVFIEDEVRPDTQGSLVNLKGGTQISSVEDSADAQKQESLIVIKNEDVHAIAEVQESPVDPKESTQGSFAENFPFAQNQTGPIIIEDNEGQKTDETDSDEMIMRLYKAGKLSPDNPKTLQLAIYLAFREVFNLNEKIHQVKFDDFSIVIGEDGQECVKMCQQEKVLGRDGFVIDPVKLFKKFCSVRPNKERFPDSPLFLQPNAKFSATGQSKWYHSSGIFKNYLRNLLWNLNKKSIKALSLSVPKESYSRKFILNFLKNSGAPKGSSQGGLVENSAIAQNQTSPIVIEDNEGPVVSQVQGSLVDPNEAIPGSSVEGFAVAPNQTSPIIIEDNFGPVITEVQGSHVEPNRGTPGSSLESTAIYKNQTSPIIIEDNGAEVHGSLVDQDNHCSENLDA